MNAKIVKKCSVTAIILVALYFLVILINPEVTRYLQKPFSRILEQVLETCMNKDFIAISYLSHTTGGFIPHHAVLSISLLIPAFMLLHYAKKEQSSQLVRTSKMTLLAGWCYFGVSWLAWISFILDEVGNLFWQRAFYFGVSTPTGEVDGGMNSLIAIEMEEESYLQYLRINQITGRIEIIFSVLACAIAVFLLIVFFISMKNAVLKRMRFKGEMVKPAVALIILGPELVYWARRIILKACYTKIPADQLSKLYNNINIVYAWIFTFLPLVTIVFMLLMHWIIKVKPDDWDDVPLDEIVYVQAENIME